MPPSILDALCGELLEWKKWLDEFGVVQYHMRSAEYTKFLEEGWDREVELQKSLGFITESATPPR